MPTGCSISSRGPNRWIVPKRDAAALAERIVCAWTVPTNARHGRAGARADGARHRRVCAENGAVVSDAPRVVSPDARQGILTRPLVPRPAGARVTPAAAAPVRASDSGRTVDPRPGVVAVGALCLRRLRAVSRLSARRLRVPERRGNLLHDHVQPGTRSTIWSIGATISSASGTSFRAGPTGVFLKTRTARSTPRRVLRFRSCTSGTALTRTAHALVLRQVVHLSAGRRAFRESLRTVALLLSTRCCSRWWCCAGICSCTRVRVRLSPCCSHPRLCDGVGGAGVLRVADAGGVQLLADVPGPTSAGSIKRLRDRNSCRSRAQWLFTGRSDALVAAVLLGLATFSKPTQRLLFAGPMLAVLVQRKRFGRAVGVAAGGVRRRGVCSYAANLVSPGDWNFQGGQRNTFYGPFPFQTPQVGFDKGVDKVTDIILTHIIFDPNVFWSRLGWSPWTSSSGATPGCCRISFRASSRWRRFSGPAETASSGSGSSSRSRRARWCSSRSGFRTTTSAAAA